MELDYKTTFARKLKFCHLTLLKLAFVALRMICVKELLDKKGGA